MGRRKVASVNISHIEIGVTVDASVWYRYEAYYWIVRYYIRLKNTERQVAEGF